MLKVAVIGVGSMGANHARVYSELSSEVKLVAVCDTRPAVAENMAHRWGVNAYTDYRELLEKEHPDAISVAVPTILHEEVAIHALEAGVHVLVEKPIASTPEAGLRVIECARKNKKQLMAGHIVRFNPAMQELKKKLAEGMLGRIFQINCRRIGPFPSRIQDVGVIVDLAPHDIDIMRYLTGLNPVRVFAEIEQRLHTDHEDLLLGLLRFPENISGGLEINWLTPTKVREVTVLGERGMFKVDDLTQDLYFYENAQASGNTWTALTTLKGVGEGSMTRFAFQRYEPLKAELQAFLHSVESGEPVPISGEDSLIALKVALAMIEAGQTHQVQELDL
jgi:UDP-N-acetylglucosamine 3-dehydrogenase